MTLTRRKEPVTYTTMDKAIEIYHLDPAQVQQAIENGDIETAHLADDDTPLLLDESLRKWIASQISRARFDHLKGNWISIYEATKRYQVSHHAITNWIKRGYVKETQSPDTSRRTRLINEADVAYARALADLKRPIAGQSVFN